MTEHRTIQSVTGTVVKVSSKQTIKIATKVTKVHPLYKKRYTRTSTYTAHDPKETAQVGDVITIVACRPISKRKSWVVEN
jgi:small subunit ribosomal protein S17